MAKFIIVGQYVGFPREGYNFGFTDVDFHTVSNVPTLYRVVVVVAVLVVVVVVVVVVVTTTWRAAFLEKSKVVQLLKNFRKCY
jgi:uncharacterized membrane protein YjgN (DUF898 family)